MPSISELDEQIGELRIELAIAESGDDEGRASGIEHAIRDLQVERDMTPPAVKR